MNIRIGQGYDVHCLSENRDLIIGGVNIPFHLGLLGHSDADVLIHSICDALLGAAGLGDIGKHFPDNDKKWKGADSRVLLQHVSCLLSERGWSIINIDSTVIAQAPKISPYIETMKSEISKAARISSDSVNVKATTEEGMGFTGAGEGISAMAVALIMKEKEG